MFLAWDETSRRDPMDGYEHSSTKNRSGVCSHFTHVPHRKAGLASQSSYLPTSRSLETSNPYGTQLHLETSQSYSTQPYLESSNPYSTQSCLRTQRYLVVLLKPAALCCLVAVMHRSCHHPWYLFLSHSISMDSTWCQPHCKLHRRCST